MLKINHLFTSLITCRTSFCKHKLTLIPRWISKYILYKIWNEITDRFPNFTGATVKVWGWISNFIPHFIGHMINYPCWDWSYLMLAKGPLHGTKFLDYSSNWLTLATNVVYLKLALHISVYCEFKAIKFGDTILRDMYSPVNCCT